MKLRLTPSLRVGFCVVFEAPPVQEMSTSPSRERDLTRFRSSRDGTEPFSGGL